MSLGRGLSVFSSEVDSKIIKGIIKAVLLWYFIDTVLFLFVGLSETNLQTIFTGIFLIFWYLATTTLFRLSSKRTESLSKNFSKWYLPLILLLSVLEETLVFLNGGGLGGKAESLTQDLLLAVPVFLGIALGILVLNHWVPLSSGEIFVITSIQGFIIELVFSGNLILAWFLGGPALGIYGMMMAAVSKEKPKEQEETLAKHVLIVLIVGTVLCLGGAILGAILGDTIYKAIA